MPRNRTHNVVGNASWNGPSHEREPLGTAGHYRVFDAGNNHLHTNPYPNVGGPGQPKLCEAANEKYIPGVPQTGNLPASEVLPAREITKREDNLFGEPYPAATLKALGIGKGAKK